MRDLHVVAVSEDGRHVLLGLTKAKASHKVRLDARLVAAVRGELGKPTGELSPKEIQARLRAGESAEQIATSAGMALTRVERFAGPVAGEMARMIDEARDGFVVRGRLGRSAVRLGKAVDAALAEHAKPESVTWTTHREDDGRWRVQVAWFSRGKTRDAAWWYEPHAKALEAVDAASAALGHVDSNPAPPRRTAKKAAPAAAPVQEKKPGVAKKAAAKKAAAKKAAAKKAPASKPVASKPVASKPVATKSTAAKSTTAKSTAARSTASKSTAATSTATKPVAKKAPPARKPAPARKAAPAGRPRLQVVPDPVPTAPTAAPKPTPAEERDGVKARASVPAWADVLLGTTPSNDR